MNIASLGKVYDDLRLFITSSFRTGDYTVDNPDSSRFVDFVNGNGDVLKVPPRTSCFYPVENYMVRRGNNLQSPRSEGEFVYKIVTRYSGANSFEQLSPAINQAHDLSSDMLTLLSLYYQDINTAIASIDSLDHDPVQICQLDGVKGNDWIIIVQIRFKVTFNLGFSDAVTQVEIPTNGVVIPEDRRLIAGIYIAEIGLEDRLKDTDVIIEK